MLKQTFVLAAALALAGCSNESSTDSARLATNAPTSPELAAYAAAHPYPTTRPAGTFPAAAIVNRAAGTIKIYNFSDQPIRDANIWVNRSFVQHINGIAPNSSAIIRFNEMYNGLGKSYSSLNEPVSTVQLEMNGQIYNIEGPAAE